LQHDKDYLSRQVGELAQKVSLAEGRLEGVGGELQAVMQAKEEVFQQLVKCRYARGCGCVGLSLCLCREEQHVQCDHRLESEIEAMRAHAAVEMDQLRSQTRDMYEREIKILSEARDHAMSERDRAKTAEKEATEKCESLMIE
jgi:progesterone-induced-blocking factor 1